MPKPSKPQHPSSPPKPGVFNTFTEDRLMRPQQVIDLLVAQTTRQGTAIFKLTRENEELKRRLRDYHA